jgi:hypothetical protein
VSRRCCINYYIRRKNYYFPRINCIDIYWTQ